MLCLNTKEYLDKLHACWIGKNIGGTMGAPYEGTRGELDVQGYAAQYGRPLPNDDLDLQLVWLCAMEDVGAAHFNVNTLADYWLDWIPPHWNEYGICKTNLRLGLLPPMSGEVDNEKWKHSNGAWIRSEIWAALAPGRPDVAVRYAIMDAMYDHGCGEGVYAEMFTAAMQSLAYVESDIHTIIDTALTMIPADCRVAQTVRLVVDRHREGLPYRETRAKILELNQDLGWFQAPSNLGFVIIGLLYGEGDHLLSLRYAINCGDDTDCTAATVGATLGILGGTAGIPAALKEPIGDAIVTVSINGMYSLRIPGSCRELTERVSRLVPSVMAANGVPFAFTDGETVAPPSERPTCAPFDRKPYSYDVTHYRAMTVRVELDSSAHIREGEEKRVVLTFQCNPAVQESRKLQMKLLLPEGWSCETYEKNISLLYAQPPHGLFGDATTAFTIRAGERVEPVNRLYAEITCPTLAYPILVPIICIG